MSAVPYETAVQRYAFSLENAQDGLQNYDKLAFYALILYIKLLF